MRGTPWLTALIVLCVGCTSRNTWANVESGAIPLAIAERATVAALLRAGSVPSDQVSVEATADALAGTSGNGVVIAGGRVRAIRLADARLATLPSLRALGVLDRIELRRSGVRSLGGVCTAPALAALSLPDNPLTDLAGIEGCRTLRELDLSSTRVTSLTALRPLAALELVFVSGTPVQSFDGLGGHPALRLVEASRAALTSLDGLEESPALEFLNVRENRISDASPLVGLLALRRVDLGRNRLTAAPALPPTVQLLVDGNPIASAPPTPPRPPATPPSTTAGVLTTELPSGWGSATTGSRSCSGRTCRATVSSLDGRYSLETARQTSGGGQVRATLAVRTGSARVYLRRDDAHYVYCEATSQSPCAIVGALLGSRGVRLGVRSLLVTGTATGVTVTTDPS